MDFKFITNNYIIIIKIVFTSLSFLLMILISKIISRLLSKYGIKLGYIEKRVIYTKKIINFFIISLIIILLLVMWGIDLQGIYILASSAFALIGIAFFAVWSVLSNVTCGLILFFTYPMKIGDRIKIVAGDDSAEGTIIDMTMFHIIIENSDKNIVAYPNNIAVQKSIIKYTSEH